ncbi:MAG TPA: FadR/GntR family transcriptional regulator [Coriobacteriia bacterium]
MIVAVVSGGKPGTAGDSDRRIRSKSVPELVIDRIVEMIALGELPPGKTLPSEREFAAQLGVSIVALREATRVLKMLGVFGSVPRRGTIVLPSAAYGQFEQLGILMALSEQTIVNVLEARSIVEGRAVRLAAMRATSDEVRELRRILERQRLAVGDVIRFPLEDEAFHRVAVAAAHNPILVTVLDGMRHPLRVLRQQTALLPGRLDKALVYHARLADAIAAGDPDAAERALLDHLEDVATDVKSRLESGGIK